VIIGGDQYDDKLSILHREIEIDKITIKKKVEQVLNIDDKPKEFNGFSPLIDFDDSKGIVHFNSRPDGQKIDKIVIHSTGSEKADRDSVVSWFRDKSSKVSAHYLITNAGKICGLVSEKMRAWHATSANSSSIGIECAGACGLKQYKEAQLIPLAKLIKDIRSRYGNIPIITHADVDPVRKAGDPFDKKYRDAAIAEIEKIIEGLA